MMKGKVASGKLCVDALKNLMLRTIESPTIEERAKRRLCVQSDGKTPSTLLAWPGWIDSKDMTDPQDPGE